MHAHMAGHILRHTTHGVMEERKKGKHKSAAGIGLIGLGFLLLPLLGPFALIPIFMGITACCCQEKVKETTDVIPT